MKGKRQISTLLVMILIISLLAGCGQKKKEGKEEAVSAKGRYVEQEIPLPEGTGEAVGLIKKEEGLTLYTWSEDKGYQSFIYKDGKWSDGISEAWLTDAMDRLELEVYFLYSGGDGEACAMASSISDNVPYGQHILRETENQKAEDITPKPLLEVDENGMTALFTDMAVLKDGTIVVSTFDSMIEFYKDGKKAAEAEGRPVNMDHQPALSAADNIIAVFGRDGRSVDFYTADNFEKKNTVDLNQDVGDAMLVPGEDGIWYMVNTAGIHRITEEGSIVETVMEGSGCMMSIDSDVLINFCTEGEKEFYGLYRIDGRDSRLMRYVFDEEAAAVQKDTISVYSLRENATVSQAVYAFQSSHPEVKVEYNVGISEEGVQTSEVIRTLNAELLNGSGADVLILDGLPMDTYIEKGILSDITKLAEELTSGGTLENIIQTAAVKDKKIYAVPARVNVPVIIGKDEEKKKACQDLAAFHEYVSQNEGTGLFEMTTCEFTGITLFHAFYDVLVDQKEGLKEEELAQFLTDCLKLCETENTKAYEEEMEMEPGILTKRGVHFHSGDSVGDGFVTITELGGLSSCMIPYAQARERGETLEALKGYYLPGTAAGINASSKNQELAEDFIRCLFDEEVQKGDNLDGFPVLKSALEAQADYVETPEAADYLMSTYAMNPVTGMEKGIEAGYPNRQEVEQLIQIIEGLETPFVSDSMMTDVVLEELLGCYDGSQTPEEAAKAICQKAGTYLAE